MKGFPHMNDLGNHPGYYHPLDGGETNKIGDDLHIVVISGHPFLTYVVKTKDDEHVEMTPFFPYED